MRNGGKSQRLTSPLLLMSRKIWIKKSCFRQEEHHHHPRTFSSNSRLFYDPFNVILFSGQTSPYLTQYILRHLLNNNKNVGHRSRQVTSSAPVLNPAQLDRKAIEEAIYGDDKRTKLIYPETHDKIKHYLDEAKELTDVIDFHQRQPESIE